MDIIHDIVHDIVYYLYDTVYNQSDIIYYIVYNIDLHLRYFRDVSTQVEELVRILKHKLRLDNAYFKAQGFNAILSALKEELHQLLIGLYGEHLLPATMYEIKKTLYNPNTIRGFGKNGAPIYIISKQRLKTFFLILGTACHRWTPVPAQLRFQPNMPHTSTTCTSDSMMEST
jgi:hypothetical protein